VKNQQTGEKDDGGHFDPKLVLIVDDIALNRTLLAELVSIAGYRVIEAADGREALEKIKLFGPALVLMDIEMPVMSGIAAVQELRRNPLYRSLPVIAITALASAEARRTALDAGFNAYIIKPCSAKDIIDATHRLGGATEEE
jgi:CheY-like chemotaxis protein